MLHELHPMCFILAGFILAGFGVPTLNKAMHAAAKHSWSSFEKPPPMRDLCFVVDGTGSMAQFFHALKDSLPQFFQLLRLIGTWERIAVLVYRDYDVHPVVEFSGWGLDATQLGEFVRRQKGRGGGDHPEAAKTAAWRLLRECSQRPCTVFWYCDAPPHHMMVGSDPCHYNAEKNAAKSYSGGDDEPFDWIEICRRIKAAGHCVHTFLSVDTASTASFYCVLGSLSGGGTLYLRNATADAIGRHSVGKFLWMAGHAYDFGGDVESLALADESGLDDELLDENDTGGRLPSRNSSMRDLMSTCLYNTEATTTGSLAARFASDDAYRATVYEVFEHILQPDMVMALTYNTVFGGLWRAVCRARDDPRREALVAQMGATVSVLPQGPKDAIKAYIEMSYDQSDEVAKLVAAAPMSPILVLEATQVLERSELLEVARSCHRGVLAKVGTLLTGLRVVTTCGERGIPLSMPNLFAVLPHLMCPGTMFSRRPAAILATLAVVTGTVGLVRDRAIEHLEANMGTWIDPALPENLSADFVRLVLRAPQYLVPEELSRFEGLRRIAGLLANGLTDLEVEVGYSSRKTVRPDRKVACNTCGHARSFTLITPTGTCGLCEGGDTDIPDRMASSHNASIWCECRTCLVHYAVVREPNVVPKCHFCRLSPPLPAPKVTCKLCANSFVYQTECEEECGDFVCPPCEERGAALTERKKANVLQYVEQNGAEFMGLSVPDPRAFFGGRSLFAVTEMAAVVAPPLVDRPEVYDKKSVLNKDSVHATVEAWIDRGEREHGMCSLCFEEMPKARLLAACGRASGRGCDAKACGVCLDAWYGEPKPGCVVLAPNLRCPFCKTAPVAKTMRRHNREAMALVEDDSQEDWYNGWCMGCYKLKPAVQRACHQMAGVPELCGFRCDACTTMHAPSTVVPLDVKECPGCGVVVDKSSGCNHIACPCGTHWCWVCRHVGDETTIYDHMYAAHRGIGLGYDNDDDNGSDDEY